MVVGFSRLWLRICAMCVWFSFILGTNSRAPSESILDMINTQEVARLLAARRENISKEEQRFLGKNALDDDEISEEKDKEEDDDFIYKDSEDDLRQQLNISSLRNFANKQVSGVRKSPTVGIDTLLRRSNDSFPDKPAQILAELSGYSGDKLLKSSKNALLVTKKEYLNRDWCKTEPLIQRVREEGCLTRTVINRFCYGQCNSFFIPKNPRKKRSRRRDSDEDDDVNDAPAFKSCAFCKPKKASWITITLNCPALSPQLKKKRILRVKQCKCITEVFN